MKTPILLTLMVLGIIGCQPLPSAPQYIQITTEVTVPVTRLIDREMPVTVQVTQLIQQEVPITVQVTQVVEQEVPVTIEVTSMAEKPVIVTATPKPTPLPSATPEASPTPEDVIDLLDWTWYRSRTGNYIYVDGEVRNTGTKSLGFVEITLKLLDADEKLLSTDSGYIEAQVLRPGATSTFKIMTAWHPEVEWVEITGFIWTTLED